MYTFVCICEYVQCASVCVWYVCSRNVSVREDYKWKLWGHMCSHGHQQPIGMSLLTVETLKRVNALYQNYRQRHNMDPIVEWLFCLTLCFRVWSDTTPISSLLTLSLLLPMSLLKLSKVGNELQHESEPCTILCQFFLLWWKCARRDQDVLWHITAGRHRRPSWYYNIWFRLPKCPSPHHTFLPICSSCICTAFSYP